jgi:hypothetical protein
MGNTLRSDGLAGAALLGLAVMELLDVRGFASLAPVIIVALLVIGLAWRSAAGDEVAAQAVLGLVEDPLDPHAVRTLGESALDDVPGGGGEEPHAQRLEDRDQPGGRIGVAGEYHSYQAPLAARFVLQHDLRIHGHDVPRHGIGRDDRCTPEQTPQLSGLRQEREVGEIGLREEEHRLAYRKKNT